MKVDCKYLNVHGDCLRLGKDTANACEGEDCPNIEKGWTKEDESDHRFHEELENGR